MAESVRVVIKNSMLYSGQRGILQQTSDHPEDPWDHYVLLDSGRMIGVMRDQIQEDRR